MAALRLLGCFAFGAGVGAAPVIGGQGAWRFEYDPSMLQMPTGTVVTDAHGWSVDSLGRLYLAYHPGLPDKHCLVRWDPDYGTAKLLDTPESMCQGTPHGLRIAREASGDYLYHVNNEKALYKTTLEGEVVWSYHGPPNNESRFEPYRPTWFAAPPGSDFLYMADGYGSSLVHVFTINGSYTGRTYGGKGTSDGKFETCHSINLDPKSGRLIVTDRENHRHQYFDFDLGSPNKFDFVSKFTVPELKRPCNIRYESGRGFSVVADLVGPVGILDHNDKLVSLINVSGLIGAGGSHHPHDAMFLPNGDLVVATWNPGHISYWRRLPKQEVAEIQV